MTESWCQSSPKHNVLFWASSVVAVSLLLLDIIITLRGIQRLSKYKSDIIVKLCISSYLLFVLSGILAVVNLISCFLGMSEPILIGWYTATLILSMFGLVTTSLLFLYRIKRRFRKTQLRIPSCLYRAFMLLSVFQSASVVLFVYPYNRYFVAYIIFMALNLTFNLLLLYLLTKIVYDLTTKFVKHSGNAHRTESVQLRVVGICTMDSNEDGTEATITSTAKPRVKKWKAPRSEAAKTTVLIAKTIRDTVCAITAFTSSNLLAIMFFFRRYASDDTTLWALSLMLIVMDHSINIICLYFQHKQSMQFYNKCCSRFHRYLYNLFYMKSSNVGSKSVNATSNEITETNATSNETSPPARQ
eukprot:131690_1